MNICIRLRSPGIPVSRGGAGSKELHSATAGSGGGIGEADGALSGAGGDSECEKSLDIVLAVTAGDLGGGGWEGGLWEVFLDHDSDIRADDR